MPYTLAKWAIWLIAAALVGGVVGWLLHSLRRPQVVDMSEETTAELERLRARVANLEPVVAESERLRSELEVCRAAAKAAKRPATADAAAVVPLAAVAVDPDAATERDRLAALVGEHEATIGDLRARLWNHEAKIGELQGLVDQARAATAPPQPDLVAGAAVLGEKVRFNDLTVVEGIGPKIAELCLNKGIKTWWGLHQTDVSALRAMLSEAGPRFQIHDPSSWPQQAGLLAEGKWQDFKTLADNLKGGKVAE